MQYVDIRVLQQMMIWTTELFGPMLPKSIIIVVEFWVYFIYHLIKNKDVFSFWKKKNKG